MNTAEREAYDAWFNAPHAERRTGWDTWLASLTHHGMPTADALATRPVFDRWLTIARDGNWSEFDAWNAAAMWFKQR